MKRLYIVILALWCCVNSITAQKTPNPYESLGIEVEVLTLSKGKYQEFHDLDSIQQIGTVLINLNTNEIVGVLTHDSIPKAYYMPKLSSSRWMGPDPLADEMASYSPYAFNFNNPVNYVDPDGRFPIPAIIVGAISGAALDYGIQVTGNLIDGKGLSSFTEVDGKSIAISAGAGATGAGLASKAGKLFSLFGRGGSKADDVVNVADDIVNSIDDGVSKIDDIASSFDDFADPKFAKQLSSNLLDHGEKSIRNSAKSISKNITKHEEKLVKYTSEGGNVSSVERELRTFKKQLDTINEFAKRNNIEIPK